MNSFALLLLTEFKFQWRHGFVAAAAIVTLIWAALLSLLPAEQRPFWFSIVASIDVSAIGLLFGYGLGMLDGSQHISPALRLTPIRSIWLALSRLMALSALTILTLSLLAVVIMPLQQAFALFPGIILCAFFFSSVGITAARRLASINQFLIFFALSGMVWAVPILYLAGLLESPIWVLLPSGGATALLKFGVENTPLVMSVMACIIQLLWTVVCVYFGERWAAVNYEHRFGGH